MAQRRFDVVVLGATGFTGRWISEYLAGKSKSGKESFNWAVAGRSQERLDELVRSLPVAVPILIADTSKPDSLDAVCASTTVIISCTGPFSLYGMPVVDACIRNRTHYVDITGEFTYVRRVIEKYHDQAQKEKIFLLPQSGFDSVPSDLVNYLAHQAVRGGAKPTSVEAFFTMGGKGGVSRGTFDSMCNIFSEVTKADQSPLSLVPKDSRSGFARQGMKSGLWYSAVAKAWTVPFLMASTNERIVRRSNFLLKSNASYSECQQVKGLVRAFITTLGIWIFAVALAVKPLRNIIGRFIAPPARGGPQTEDGFFRVVGIALSGRTPVSKAVVSAPHGGYRATAVMVSEVALALAKDVLQGKGSVPYEGGVLTAAAAVGPFLKRRLTENGFDITQESL